MTDTKTEYYFSKIAIILTSILLLVISLLFAFVTYVLYSANLKVPMLICLSIFLLFLTTFPNFYKRINFFLTDIPALILTKDELIDNINLQTFKWMDVKTITSTSIHMELRVRYIAIALIIPARYIDKISNPYKRLNARLNQKYFSGAFIIQPNIVKCNNTELLNNLTKYFDDANDQNSR